MSTSTAIDKTLTHTFLDHFPAEAASYVERLSEAEQLELVASEAPSLQARVLLRMNREVAVGLLKKLNDRQFTKLLSNMDPAEGVLLLSRMDDKLQSSRLALLPDALAKEYRELLIYPPDTAGHLMDPRVMAFHGSDSVEYVLKRLRKLSGRRVFDVCVLDDEKRLTGVVSVQEIALVKPTRLLSELITETPFTIHALSPREDVVELMQRRNLASLPVVDLENVLLGIIRSDKLVVAAQMDASEDLQAMFGAGRDERALSRSTFAVRKRLPWLIINLGTAFLASIVVGLFEDTIAQLTALAIFLPVVAGQSGNTGSQALAVTMRGLALREIRGRHWFQVARKEVLVGFINGVAVALLTGLVVYLWMSSLGLGLVIAAAMVFSMVLAGLSGAVIPIILKAFGQDPAQSSSIVLTTVTDVVGFMSFLGLATLFASYLVTS